YHRLAQHQRDLQGALVVREPGGVAEDEDHRRDADQVEEGDAEFLARSGEEPPGRAAVLRVLELPEVADDLDLAPVGEPALEQVLLADERLDLLRQRVRTRDLESVGQVLDREVLGHLIGDQDRGGDEREQGPLAQRAVHAWPSPATARLQRRHSAGWPETSASARPQRSHDGQGLRATCAEGASPPSIRRVATRTRSASCASYFSATSRRTAGSRGSRRTTSASLALPISFATRLASSASLTTRRKLTRWRNSSSSASSTSCGSPSG